MNKKIISLSLLLVGITASSLCYVTIDTKSTVISPQSLLKIHTPVFSPSNDKEIASVESITRGVKSLNNLLEKQDKLYNISIDTIKQHILNLAKSHKEALDTLIVIFEQNTENRILQDELLDILSRIHSKKVEKLGLRLIESNHVNHMIDGLDLISMRNIVNEKILTRAFEIIEKNKDKDALILSAIRAMPKMELSEEKHLEIINLYALLTTHENGVVRSKSLMALSKWARNESELTPIILVLEGTDEEDRISAMTALTKSSVVSAQIKDILLSYMLDESEQWEIRLLSSHSLKRFELNATQNKQHENFTKNQLSLK